MKAGDPTLQGRAGLGCGEQGFLVSAEFVF